VSPIVKLPDYILLFETAYGLPLWIFAIPLTDKLQFGEAVLIPTFPVGITVNKFLSNVVAVADVLVLTVKALQPGTYDSVLLPPPYPFVAPPAFKQTAQPQ